MEADQLFEKIREVYLTTFRKALATSKAARQTCLVEAFLNDEGAMKPTLDPFQVPMQQDLALIENGELAQVMVVKSRSNVQFGSMPLTFAEDFFVGLGPFEWDECLVIA